MKCGPVAEWVRSLYFRALNHSIVSLLCLVYVRALHWPHVRQRESIIGVQWGQGNPNPRVNRSSGKRGVAEFPTGTVDPRVGIYRFHCTPMIDSISHISNTNIFIHYIFQFWRDTVVYLWRSTVKYVRLEVTSDVLKLF